MARVGSVEIEIKLALDQLQRDARAASEKLRQQLKDVDIQLAIRTDTAGKSLAQLQADVLKAKAAIAGNPAEVSQLNKEAELFQELVRYKQQLAAIDADFVDEKDIAQAKALAAELNKLNVQKISQRSQAQGNSSGDVAGLSQTLGRSFGASEQFAKSLGLTAQQADNAVRKLRELDAVGATNQQKFAALNNELGISAVQFNRLNVAAGSTKAGLTAIAAGATAVGAAISAAFVKGTQDFIAFDSAIRQSGVISGSFGTPELAALREEVERLGIVTSKTPQDIAAVSVSLSRAGFSAVETTAALEGIVRASEATGETLAITGDIIAKTTRSFGLLAEDSGVVADALVATANNTNTSVSGLGESLVYVGSVAKASNQPLNDTLVLLGLLGDAGIQGSTAGTNLAAALERLKIASAGGETEFSNLVRGSARATEAFRVIGAEVRNADGSMKSVLDILPVIQKNLSTLGQADKDVLMKALFGVEGGRAFQTLLNVTPERLALITSRVQESQGVAEESGQALLQGLGGALNLLEGSIGALSTKFGEFAAVGIEPLVRAATSLINTFLNLPAPLQGVIIQTTALTGALAIAVAALTAYNLLNIQRVTTEALASAESIKNTIVTVANTAATTAGATAKGAYAIATGKATISLAAFSAQATAATLAIAPLVVAAAGLAAINFIRFTEGLEDVNDALEQYQARETVLGQQSIALATRIKAAVDAKTKAQESGTQQTEEEVKANQRLITAGQDQVKALQEQIDAIKAIPAQNEEQQRSQDALIQSYQSSINAINRQTEALAGNVDAGSGAADATEDQISAIDQLTAAYDASNSQLETANKLKQAEIQNAVNEGLLTEEEGRQKNLDLEAQYLNQRLALNESKLAELKALQAAATDPEEIAKLGSDILAAESEVADSRLSLAQNAARQREEVERQALEKVASAIREAEAQINQSQQTRTIEVRQTQLDGGIDAEEAARRIAEIQQDSIRETIALRQQELSQVSQLREQGTLSAEEAAQREIELNSQIGQLNLQRIEGEIAAQEAARQEQLNGIQEEAAAQQVAFQAQQVRQDAIRQSLSTQNGLLSAQANLSKALSDLTLQRLQTRLQEAESEGNVAAAEQSRLAIVDEQIAQADSQAAIAQQQLDLKYQQLELDTESNRLQAEAAALEAEIAVRTARVNGESETQIRLLQQIVDIRNQQVAAIGREADAARGVLDLERQTLGVQQQRTDEALRAARAAEAKDPLTAAGSGGIGSSSGGSSGFGSSGGGGSGQGLTQLLTGEQATQNAQLSQLISDSIKSGNTTAALLNKVLTTGGISQSEFLKDQLAVRGRSDVLQLERLAESSAAGLQQALALAQAADTGQIDNSQLIAKIDQLIGKGGGNTFYITAPDPVSAYSSLLRDDQDLSRRASRI